MKYLFDFIHGNVQVSSLMLKIIDTPEFQRLKYMSQIGSSRFVYPSANGDRFSHSLGVCHLTRKVCFHLKDNYPKLITDRKIELLCIAGLIHDIGHGPFSHVFDYIVKDKKSENKIHEKRSEWIFKFMVKKYNLPIHINEINFICEAINPTELFAEHSWEYQIISNTVDVDRLDYVLRDSKNSGIPVSLNVHQVERLIRMIKIIDNKIYFEPKAAFIIKSLLNARKDMFEIMYRHKTSVVVDEMLKDVIENIQHIEKYNLDIILNDVKKFLELDDSILRQIFYNPEVPFKVKQIINRIFMRDFYKLDKVYEYEKIKFNVNFTSNVDMKIFYGLIK